MFFCFGYLCHCVCNVSRYILIDKADSFMDIFDSPSKLRVRTYPPHILVLGEWNFRFDYSG